MWEMVSKTRWGQGWVVPRAVVSLLAIQLLPASNMYHSMISSTVLTHLGALVSLLRLQDGSNYSISQAYTIMGKHVSWKFRP